MEVIQEIYNERMKHIVRSRKLNLMEILKKRDDKVPLLI